ncbi:MAG: tRNA lysidine(34) synthetase TilS [Alphaproteobacteria bacterium]|nr:tRNA lysidine(34) synthetase TilS [Alphaproteobacteria bacterium]
MAQLPRRPWPAAVAVSGGADSLALAWLLARWAMRAGLEAPIVLTVDHGLSPGSENVAQQVVELASAWQLTAHVLSWRGVKPATNLEAAARAARYHLLGTWCRRHGIAGLYVGHTLEDQAETVLLRLGRGSGVDGLCAMAGVSAFPLPGFSGLSVVRPLLSHPRTALRALLGAQNIAWHEDPMNEDPRFCRVRLRKAWPALIEAGLAPERLALAAHHLSRARAALQSATETFLSRHCSGCDEGLQFDRDAFVALPQEIGLRVLSAVLMQVSGRTYRPRFRRLVPLYNSICSGELGAGRTLLGCRLSPVPRARQRFGAASLWVRGEAPRRRHETVPAGVMENGASEGGSSRSDMGD